MAVRLQTVSMISWNLPTVTYNIIDWQTPFTWLWIWLPLRLSKSQSPTTVLFRTTLTRTITLYELVILIAIRFQSVEWAISHLCYARLIIESPDLLELETIQKGTVSRAWWRQSWSESRAIPIWLDRNLSLLPFSFIKTFSTKTTFHQHQTKFKQILFYQFKVLTSVTLRDQ